MRLIDANALLENLPVVEKDKQISLIGAVADMVVLISNAPTIDAVPVVRCKDCENTDPPVGLPEGMFYCNEWESITHAHWYCCRGEKKEED